MSELRDRLEALATRGNRRGADDVLRAAQRDAQTISSDDSRADLDGTDMQIIDGDLPVVALEPRSGRRRRFGSFVASAGVAALVGVGALAVTAMFGSGGAGSPEAAVRQLADAVNNKDALAAVDVLVPSEVRSMRASVENITERAAELRIVDEASKPLAGVDLSVDHLELRTEPLADGYAKVIITSGEFSASTNRAELSALLQKAQRDGEDARSHSDLSTLAADADLPTFIVVVRQGGGWYVSPAYTTLEYIREVNEYSAADFGSAQPAQLGAATPEDAVKDALYVWQAADWDRLLALAPPDELPLYDYRAMIAEAAADTEVTFTIDHFSTSATESGDSAIVKLDASGSTGNGDQRWQVGGSCPPFESESSGDSPADLCLSGNLAGTVPFGLMVAGGSSEGETSGPVSISVVREDGRWFVGAISTALNVIDATVRNIDQRAVYTLLGLAYELPPDGTITLDQPFDVAAPTAGHWLSSRVYAFEGQAGQELIGEINSGSYSSESAYASLYTPDGEPVGSIDFQRAPSQRENYFYASTTRLPTTGSYRLVLEPYWGSRENATLTLWDLTHAPKALRDAAARNGEEYPGSECTYSPGVLGGYDGYESCTVTATTIPGAGGPPQPLSPLTPTTYMVSPDSGSVTGTTAPSTTIGK